MTLLTAYLCSLSTENSLEMHNPISSKPEKFGVLLFSP